uniref:THAP domain-containing protein 1 n=1 Tax=Sander lucioperca TaxID=283035 RepID=A0A8C9XF12_SANLU
MVPVCAFPNCGNQMKRYLSLSFHRLPLRNREILQLWLVVLQLDVQTPLRTLRERDYRVCSEHFDEDDFTEKSVKSRYLKANAIPKVKRPTADKLESFSDSASASGNGKGWSERKWLVNESKLLELFALCRTCGSAIEDKTIITQSSQIRVQWNCINEHSGTWSSCPDIRGMPASNLIISQAALWPWRCWVSRGVWIICLRGEWILK